MEREQFLAGLASCLGRPPQYDKPIREFSGVTDRYAHHPFGQIDLPQTEWLKRFVGELISLGANALVAESIDSVPSLLKTIFDKAKRGGIVTWHRSEFASWNIDFVWDEYSAVDYSEANDELDDTALKQKVQTATIGLTTVNYAIVNTGTLALYINEFRNRSVSLLPTEHIALVAESQLVARLGDALPSGAHRQSSSVPSSINFISGPSRSADIENDLSIGVHGPAVLTVIICKGK